MIHRQFQQTREKVIGGLQIHSPCFPRVSAGDLYGSAVKIRAKQSQFAESQIYVNSGCEQRLGKRMMDYAAAKTKPILSVEIASPALAGQAWPAVSSQ